MAHLRTIEELQDAVRSAELLEKELVSLTVNCMAGRKLAVNVNPRESITVFRSKVAQRLDISPSDVILNSKDKELVDGRSISDYGLRDGSVVHCSPKLGAGLHGYRRQPALTKTDLTNMVQQQIQEAVAGLTPQELQQHCTDGHCTFQTEIGGQQVEVQVTLAPDASVPTTAATTQDLMHPTEEAPVAAKKLFYERLDQLKAQAKADESRRIDNSRLAKKIDAVKERLQQRKARRGKRRNRNRARPVLEAKTASKPSNIQIPTPLAQPSNYGGLRKGFLGLASPSRGSFMSQPKKTLSRKPSTPYGGMRRGFLS